MHFIGNKKAELNELNFPLKNLKKDKNQPPKMRMQGLLITKAEINEAKNSKTKQIVD